MCTPEYLLGNQSEGSSDPAKHSVVNILYPRVPRFSHRPSTYPPTTCSDFCQSGHSLIHLLSPQWFVQTREFKPIWKEQSGELCCGFQPQILFNVTTLAGRPQKKEHFEGGWQESKEKYKGTGRRWEMGKILLGGFSWSRKRKGWAENRREERSRKQRRGRKGTKEKVSFLLSFLGHPE